MRARFIWALAAVAGLLTGAQAGADGPANGPGRCGNEIWNRCGTVVVPQNAPAADSEWCPGGGGLQVVVDGTIRTLEFPLKHTDVNAEIAGSLARVTVTQTFQNPFPDPIEAVYV
ncbi:MAG: hypothetical protein HKN12_08800, partial [Gemmatimonadetes bacterium]|nr:hypothetical protein [Gemmatimonadota bacterium]